MFYIGVAWGYMVTNYIGLCRYYKGILHDYLRFGDGGYCPAVMENQMEETLENNMRFGVGFCDV